MKTYHPLETPTPQIVLSGDDRACLSCGQRVSADLVDEEVAFTAVGQVTTVGGSEIVRDSATSAETVLARCSSCHDRLRAARLLLDQHPSFVRRLGRETAEHQLSAALDAFAAAGLDYPREQEWTEMEVRALLRHLAAPGVAARWSRRFAPVLALDARPGTAMTEPWAHLTREQHAAIRDGHARLLAARVARSRPDVPIAPPQGRACAFCGLGAMLLPAEQVAEKGGPEWAARDVWEAVTVNPRTLGGRHQPSREPAALCLDCSVSFAEVGRIGQDAMLHAYGEHLLRLGLIDEEQAIKTGRVVGLLGWLAIEQMDRLDGQPPTPTNAQPWAHLHVEDMPGVLRRRS